MEQNCCTCEHHNRSGTAHGSPCANCLYITGTGWTEYKAVEDGVEVLEGDNLVEAHEIAGLIGSAIQGGYIGLVMPDEEPPDPTLDAARALYLCVRENAEHRAWLAGVSKAKWRNYMHHAEREAMSLYERLV